jgi:putative acetyltransferase
MKIVIRKETRSDYEVISQINDLAFGQEDEGEIVVKLRNKPDFIRELSLIALFEGQMVGHILFFPLIIRYDNTVHKALSLSPMSVMPEFQGMGIGTQLVEEGLKKAKELGFKAVIVLGHKDFYPRFGFRPASQWKISPPFNVPDANFMALELEPAALEHVSGVVEYPAELMENV